MNNFHYPDKDGYFRVNENLLVGGRFVPETVMSALYELEEAYEYFVETQDFQEEFGYFLKEYAGRPTPLYYAKNLSNLLGNKIYLKREDLLHTGAHKINNTLGQVLLARNMGKKRVIAETGAGQHGVATATAAAIFGLECVIYMGSEDMKRQKLNVFRMRTLGAEVMKVESGSQTLKDAINEALRDWITNVRTTHYVIGSVVGPHPYPKIVRDFQAIIGKEAKEQIQEKEARLPDYLIACVGGGSNAMGLFHPFYQNSQVKFIGVEAGGVSFSARKHAASLCRGRLGILHGSLSYVLQDKYGQILTTHSISAGLDYPGVGPEHAFYKLTNRAQYFAVGDHEAIEGFYLLAEHEGILPALEPAHAIAFVKNYFKDKKNNNIIIINLSGRGDKDVEVVMKYSKKLVKRNEIELKTRI